jgi:hypothetical protein
MTMRTHLWLAMTLVVAGCAAAPPAPFAVEVRALTDEDQPLRGVTVALEGKAVGTTDGNGVLRLLRHEREGTRLAVGVDVPRGYKLVDDVQPLVLRRMRRVVDGVVSELPVEHTVRFSPLQRQYAVLVDVGAPNLAVEAFGARRAVTNSSGVASFLYTGAPGDELAVQVRSDGHPELKAKTVSASFVLASRSEAYLVEGRFDAAPPVVVAPAPHARVHVRRMLPKRL